MSSPNDTPALITVQVTNLASGGSCVGTIQSPEEYAGKKAFIPYTVPGEVVEARIIQNKRAFVNAELVSIASPSGERASPACPVFGSCGGCDLQHIELQSQRRLKGVMVEDLLRLHGGVVAREGVSLLAPHLPGLAYRRRMSFHINKKREFGLYRKNGRSIVEITHCPISTPTINAFLAEHLVLLKECAPEVETITVEDHSGEVYVALEIHPKNAHGLDTLLVKEGFKELERRVPNLQVHFRHKPVYRAGQAVSGGPPVGHFSQNNEAANDAMIRYILQHVSTERVTDLFAGAGNISIPLAKDGHMVTAVELDPALVAFGKVRAEQSGVADRVTFHSKSCEKWVEHFTPDETVVLDPPRGGALEVCRRLSPTLSPHLVYVSCYPPTFARDVQALTERGYVLRRVEVLDMFPQTYHSELVALIEPA